MSELGAVVPVSVEHIKTGIINPLLKLLIALAVLYFLFGVLQYFVGARERSDSEAASKGKSHMLYGLIGVAITISAFGIVNLIANFISAVK